MNQLLFLLWSMGSDFILLSYFSKISKNNNLKCQVFTIKLQKNAEIQFEFVIFWMQNNFRYSWQYIITYVFCSTASAYLFVLFGVYYFIVPLLQFCFLRTFKHLNWLFMSDIVTCYQGQISKLPLSCCQINYYD